MYASIRQYRVRAGDTDEIVRLVQSGFVPIIRAVNGFREYRLVAGNNGELTTVSLFDDQGSAEESARKTSGWVQQMPRECLCPGAHPVARDGFRILAGNPAGTGR